MKNSPSTYGGYFYLLVDEERVALSRHYDADISVSSSATINLALNAGQLVRVENLNSDSVYGTVDGVLLSWFSGHLLYALQ